MRPCRPASPPPRPATGRGHATNHEHVGACEVPPDANDRHGAPCRSLRRNPHHGRRTPGPSRDPARPRHSADSAGRSCSGQARAAGSGRVRGHRRAPRALPAHRLAAWRALPGDRRV
ncbi:MAG: hypothetical protein COZ57_04415, partial [Armatimonadetes bacterium CG_4_8_14_3_um_filter_66_20]